MVESVERLEAELSFNSLRNCKVLKERDIGIEEAWSCQSVAPAAKLGFLRTKERTADLAIGRQRIHGGKELNSSVHWIK